jgi:hypothetical protein
MSFSDMGISKDALYFLFWGVFGMGNFWLGVYLIIRTIKEAGK